MEVITIDSKAFKKLMEKLDALSDYVYSMKQSPEENDDESWVDSHEVCDFLKISERTLQRLRSDGKITFTCLGGKYYYQISEIKKLLKARVIKSSEECFLELVQHHRQSEARRKGGR
nr:helix-turn-helix domain-containing protein [Alistipes onderdonkii]